MTETEKRKLGQKRNVLLRYKAIQEEFLRHNPEDIPVTRIHKAYIYPKFFISKTTLYTVLGTPIKKILKEIEEIESQLN